MHARTTPALLSSRRFFSTRKTINKTDHSTSKQLRLSPGTFDLGIPSAALIRLIMFPALQHPAFRHACRGAGFSLPSVVLPFRQFHALASSCVLYERKSTGQRPTLLSQRPTKAIQCRLYRGLSTVAVSTDNMEASLNSARSHQASQYTVKDVIADIVPAYWNDALQNGTPNWDIVIARTMSMLLYGLFFPAARQIPRKRPKFIDALQFKDLEIKLVSENGVEILAATLNYRKTATRFVVSLDPS